jgi:SulP family sulfate permease
MHNVNNCDYSGIHMLESVIKMYRDRGGDVYLVRVGFRVDKVMNSTGFNDTLGGQNFLADDAAISDLFYRVLDPAVCIYECPVRVFRECQNLPKQLYTEDIPLLEEEIFEGVIEEIEPDRLWDQIHLDDSMLTVIDVREPREFRRGHIPDAQLVPLPKILSGEHKIEVGGEHEVVFVCRSGRRSRRAAMRVIDGHCKVSILKGGMLAWETSGLLEAIE